MVGAVVVVVCVEVQVDAKEVEVKELSVVGVLGEKGGPSFRESDLT